MTCFLEHLPYELSLMQYPEYHGGALKLILTLKSGSPHFISLIKHFYEQRINSKMPPDISINFNLVKLDSTDLINKLI
jgi:hypothetical protein